MFVGWRKKSLQLGLLLALIFFVILFLLHSYIYPSKGLNYLDSLSLSVWNSHLPLTSESSFNNKVSHLLASRRKNDVEDVFWAIDTEITEAQTQLEIPSYFFESSDSRQDVQPFDPRFTLAFYYHHLRVHGAKLGLEAPFHWADWMDMSVLNQFLFADGPKKSCSFLDHRDKEEKWATDHKKKNPHHSFDPALFCVADINLPADHDDGNALRYGFNVVSKPGKMTEEKAFIAGRSYMYSTAPPPTSVIFLTDSGSYNITTGKRQKLLHNGLVDDYVKRLGAKTVNTLKEFRLLNKQVPCSKDKVMTNYEVKLEHKDFVLLPLAIIKELSDKEKQSTLSTHERSYLDSIKFSLAKEEHPPKYFTEVKLFDTAIGDHYDWRFFGGVKLFSFEQNAALHRMTRAWLSFCRKQGITTWMAHGSLLSWYWNGFAFPWDNDIDVQVPVMDLHKLGMHYNQSLVVEDANDGFGRYFLDCGSSITVRNHANGLNNIDARFIDIDSGLYIDITGLAVSSDKAPDRYKGILPDFVDENKHANVAINNELQVYNCRNKHFLSLKELSPLIKSYVEGEVAYIPKRYSDILMAEYHQKGLMQKFFTGRLFMPQLRLWILQDSLKFFLRARKQWNLFYGSKSSHSTNNANLERPNTNKQLTTSEISHLLELKEKDLLDLLLDDEILIDYVLLRDTTALHEAEIMRLLFGKSTESLVEHAPDFKPLKYDPFLYKLRQDYNSFELEVRRFQTLYENHVNPNNKTSIN